MAASMAVAVALLAACGSGGSDDASPSTNAPAPGPAGDGQPATAGRAQAGDVVVVDNGGRVLAIEPESGAVRVVSSNELSTAAGGQALFADLLGVAQEPGGDFVVIARSGTGDDPNPDPSRVIRVDAETGAQSLINGDGDLHFLLTTVAVGPDGTIWVGDEGATGAEPGSVIYRVDPATGAKSVFTGNVRHEAVLRHGLDSPLGIVVDEDGFWVAAASGGDDSAPDTPSDYRGAVVRVDPATGVPTLVSSNHRSTQAGGAALFGEPRFLARARDGSLLVVDDLVINHQDATADDTRVIRVDPTTGAQTLVSDNARSSAAGGERLFERPYGVAELADGTLVVTDGDRLIRVDPTTGAQSLLASGLGNAIAVTIAR